MHRRHFLGMIAGAVLPPTQNAFASQNATPAPPRHSGRPRPIVLGDGIELIDYRLFPSSDKRRVIGEIWNTRDDMVDAPIVTMTFPGMSARDGFAFAPAFLPIMPAGASNLVFGVIPDEVDSEEKLAAARFELCGEASAGEHSERHRDVHIRYEVTESNLWATALSISGHIWNEGPSVARLSVVRGLVRDRNGRYAGCTSTAYPGDFGPGDSRPFSIQVNPQSPPLADPFAFIDEEGSYSVEIFPGLVGPVIPPTCAAPGL